VTVSRRTLLSTLGLMLPVAAAEAATKRKRPHKVAKAVPHKPAKHHKVARRHTPAKPAAKPG
jgi:hypothetical protein